MKFIAYFLRRLLITCLCAALLWCAGFAWFAAHIPTPLSHTESPARTDAIVVLTGGAGRLDHALDLLVQGEGKKLFVSGVENNIPVEDLFKASAHRNLLPALKNTSIDIGYVARDTKGNALETADWMDMQGFKSMRLVTASYHMRRSLFEFRQLMPRMEIVAEPVFPPPFDSQAWVLNPKAFGLALLEYHKYLATRLHALFI